MILFVCRVPQGKEEGWQTDLYGIFIWSQLQDHLNNLYSLSHRGWFLKSVLRRLVSLELWGSKYNRRCSTRFVVSISLFKSQMYLRGFHCIYYTVLYEFDKFPFWNFYCTTEGLQLILVRRCSHLPNPLMSGLLTLDYCFLTICLCALACLFT